MRWPLLLASVLVAGCAVVPVPPDETPATSQAPVPTSASPTPSPTPTPTPEPAPTCRAEAEALELPERAGQLVMVGVEGPLDAAERRAITRHHLGSVILMGTSTRGVAGTADLTDSLQDLTDGIGLLVAVDQEGGAVQRLRGAGFDRIPAAADQAKLSPTKLTRRATGWARQLAKAGVQLNLAPVADVVPRANRTRNEPVAQLRRGYGSDPAKVSAHVGAFIDGMHAGGVGAAVKHFPGLGAVRGNTDFAEEVVDSETTSTSPLLTPFADAIKQGSDAVMVSSAVYRKIDPDRMATFSPVVIGLLREWGFDKVVISDDLGAAAALRKVPGKQRATRFVAAGGDLALSVDPEVAVAMATGLVSRATDDPDFAEQLTASAARVLAQKQAYGLVECR